MMSGLAAETQVWRSAGGYSNIKDLVDTKKEFLTDTFDLAQMCFVCNQARAEYTGYSDDLVEILYGYRDSFGDSRTTKLVCTDDTEFLVSTNNYVAYDSASTELKWVKAKDLQAGMRLVAEDAYITVKNVKKSSEFKSVYSVRTEDGNFSIKLGVIVKGDKL